MAENILAQIKALQSEVNQSILGQESSLMP